MIIVLKPGASEQDIKYVTDKIEKKGYEAIPSRGRERTVINVIGNVREEEYENGWRSIPCVEKVVRILKPYKLSSKEHHREDTVIDVNDVSIGGKDCVLIAGPCSVESEEQVMRAAEMMKENGVRIMRASAFKPRTSPYSFQGLGIEGLKLLKKVRDQTGLAVETEVMDVRDVPIAAEHVDILRVGARNMQNYDLLKELGKIDKPVIIKRGMSSTIKELLMAAEYVMYHGNHKVILCERGIRTFETAYRNTLDVGAVAVLKRETHLPVIVDPSHAAGNRELIPAFSKASVAAGADGLLVESHPSPEEALSDGAQSLTPGQLADLIKMLRPVAEAVGRSLV